MASSEIKREKYERILQAAIKVFAQKGFYHSRISDIAQEADVASGTIYLYFKNKDDILISIFEEKMKEAIEIFQKELATCKDALSKLKLFVKTHFKLFSENPDLAAVLQVELRQSSRFMKEYKKVELKRFLDLIGEIVRQGQEEGIFRKDLSISLVKRFIFGAMDEMVSTWVLSRERFNLNLYAEPLAELFIKGLVEEKAKEEVKTLEKSNGGESFSRQTVKGGKLL